MIIGCVVQGNIRRNSKQIIDFLKKKFDIVILSTWVEDEVNCQGIDCIKLFNRRPINPGLHNRNLQQLTTVEGIKLAKKMGCEYVMKWRTDMLPIDLDVNKLLKYSNYNIPHNFNSRLVILAFRNLSCSNDWFSSIPDLFVFGGINEVEMLWNDNNYNYDASFNAPNLDVLTKLKNTDIEIVKTIWPTEAQLYSRLKCTLLSHLNLNDLSHEFIIKNNFYLVDIHELKIIWFDSSGGFRSVFQSYEQEWWSVKTWKGKSKVKIVDVENIYRGFLYRFRLKANSIIIRYMKFVQMFNYFVFSNFNSNQN